VRFLSWRVSKGLEDEEKSDLVQLAGVASWSAALALNRSHLLWPFHRGSLLAQGLLPTPRHSLA
ncbi:MAG: hypothetical protein AAGD07_12910, partial [Planctomycetota bacterium]